MSYNLPFKQGDKVIELGGANQNLFHPNVDVRQCYDANGKPTVDFTADFNKPLPIMDNEWDGVFQKFSIEHMSWRNLRNFIKEIYRILAPGGTAVFVTANLLEQARILVETPYWEDHHVGMIFGDQNYDGDEWKHNAHYVGFSPERAGRLFKEAGFDKVIMLPWPQFIGDLIIEATKGIHMSKEEMFNRHYFHGGNKIGGYDSYRDFPSNWVLLNRILEEKPESVLDIGCSRGFLVKKLNDAGILANGIDISEHCQLTRAASIIKHDLCETPWPVDKYDLLFSHDVLQLIPEEDLEKVFKEMSRVSRRGLHGISFGDKPKEWWQSKMPPDHKVISKDELEKDSSMWSHIPTSDGETKLNLGSFTNMAAYDWINIDILNLEQFAKDNYFKFYQKDVREGLPFENDSVSLIFSSHMLEHLTYDEGKKLLNECKRVMKKGAIARFLVPNAELLISKYKDNNLDMFDEINDGAAGSKSQIGKLWSILFSGHQAAYDFATIKEMAEAVGFKVEKKSFMEGNKQIIKETLDMLADLSLFVELEKI